jgi:hypothetical protein
MMVLPEAPISAAWHLPLCVMHRLLRKWRDWDLTIGASGQVVNWIRHGLRVKFKQGH